MLHNFDAIKPKATAINTTNPSRLYFQPDALKVIQKRDLTSNTYVLRLERRGIRFKAGQHISLGIPETGETREYSIYSGENDNYIEVLIREVEEGLVSKKLKNLKKGKLVKFDGPVGYFQLSEKTIRQDNLLFIASGTGIAPFHSFVQSYPDLNYQLLHGVRSKDEAYEKDSYSPGRYVLCTSRDGQGGYSGRVTDYLKQHPVDNRVQVYLCGNCEMIHDAYDILLDQGIPADHIHSEVYF